MYEPTACAIVATLYSLQSVAYTGEKTIVFNALLIVVECRSKAGFGIDVSEVARYRQLVWISILAQ